MSRAGRTRRKAPFSLAARDERHECLIVSKEQSSYGKRQGGYRLFAPA